MTDYHNTKKRNQSKKRSNKQKQKINHSLRKETFCTFVFFYYYFVSSFTRPYNALKALCSNAKIYVADIKTGNKEKLKRT